MWKPTPKPNTMTSKSSKDLYSAFGAVNKNYINKHMYQCVWAITCIFVVWTTMVVVFVTVGGLHCKEGKEKRKVVWVLTAAYVGSSFHCSSPLWFWGETRIFFTVWYSLSLLWAHRHIHMLCVRVSMYTTCRLCVSSLRVVTERKQASKELFGLHTRVWPWSRVYLHARY